MAAEDTVQPASSPEKALTLAPELAIAKRGVVSTGWLAADSTFGDHDDRKLGRAFSTSLAFHIAFLVAIAFAFRAATKVVEHTDPLEFKVAAFVPEEGRGGGGGGSPAPAPPKAIEIPKHQAPAAVPIPVPTPAVDPPPSLVAPIETNSVALLQAPGTSSVSLASFGGGGAGGGLGAGKGNGVGEGTGGGFGGGAYAPGNGVTWPRDTHQEKPKYTPDGMRAKIQGIVDLEIVVLENGKVGEVRVIKSLDRASGLDDAAVAAAKLWTFIPGMKDGKPVPTRVTMQLEFRLH